MDADTDLRDSFHTWLRENTPTGTRLVVRLDGITEIEVCCNGSVSWTALVCCLDPGHADDCWSKHKNVDFTPEKGGPVDYLVTQGPRPGLEVS